MPPWAFTLLFFVCGSSRNRFLKQIPSHLRRIWRLSRLTLHLGYGLAVAALVLPRLQGPRRERLISGWSAHVLRILNVRMVITGMLPTVDARAVLFVANHVSWLDIWAINTVRSVRFIAKSEMRDWPVIGWLSKKTGVIFIERARRHDTSRVSVAGAEVLRGGDCLCVFPEGTTSDGTHLYPFKSSLLQSAVDAVAPVWPVAVSYPMQDGTPNTAVAYAGDTTLAQSMHAILGQREIVVQLIFAPPILPHGLDRRDLAQTAEQVISSLVRLPVRAAPGKPSDPPA
jgi:1-acyl-sn-glycerol-3-phosphate acyltransferase